MTKEYTSKDIYVLQGLDPVRKRPGMYIGSTGPEGLHHLIKECLDNSLDEAMAGHAQNIEVTLLSDERVSVSDDGRGIPVDMHPQTKKSALETVLTTLHAGAKFGGKAYQVSGGLHGVGVSVVCALSKWSRAEVSRDGYKYYQEYSKGKTKTKLIKEGKTKSRGTTIIFEPDPEIFKEIKFTSKKIISHLRQQAYLTKGVNITFRDKRDKKDEKYSFYFEGGLLSYVKYLTRGSNRQHSNIFYVSGVKDDIIVEASFLYTQEYETYEESFTNNILTREGGSHLTGFRAALTRTLNDYAKKNNLLKNGDDNLGGEDVREGLTAVVSVKVKEPQFEGQTKSKLGNPEVKPAVEAVVAGALADFLERNPQDGKSIVEKCLLSSKARKAARAARETVIRKGVLEGLSLPGKLSDCSSRKPEESELYIIEGESAAGSCKGARDRRFQAILPLKGKILNVEKARLDRMLASKEIKSLIIAMGTAIAEDFNLDKLRYHRIILMADADSVTKDTPIMVFNKEKQEFFLTEVGEFIDNCDDTVKYQVSTYNNDNQKRELKDIYQTVRHPLRTSLFEIKTYCGYPIKITDCHSIYVYEKGKVITKKGSQVKVNDQLVFPKEFSRNDREVIIDLTQTIFSCNQENISIKVERKELKEIPEKAWCELDIQSWRMLQKQRELLSISRREMGESIKIYDKVIQQWEQKIDNVMPRFNQFNNYLEKIKTEEKNLDYYIYVPIKDWQKDVPLNSDFYLENHTRKLTTQFELDQDLANLIGFYLGDGYFSPEKNSLNRFSFALNKEKSEKYIENISRIVQEKFKAKVITDKKDNVIILCFHSFEFKLILSQLGLLGKKAPEKFIPDVFFNVKREIQESLLKGLLESDGFITVSKDKAIYGWRLSSKKLALGIITICRQLGLFPLYGVYKNKDHLRKDGKVIRSNFDSHDVSISTIQYFLETKNVWQDHKDADKLSKYLTKERTTIGKQIEIISPDFVALKVREVKEIKNPEDKFVYDFSVVGHQNFIAGHGGVLLHNSDGNHIKTLLLTLFYRYFKPIIESGYLYIAQPPLYKIQSGKRVEYAYNDDDKNEIVSSIKEEEKKENINIQRYKGLGEMNPGQLWETTMNPENRVLLKVTVEDVKEADRIFDVLMGEEVLPRKKFIQTHAQKVKNLDV